MKTSMGNLEDVIIVRSVSITAGVKRPERVIKLPKSFVWPSFPKMTPPEGWIEGLMWDLNCVSRRQQTHNWIQEGF
jgi:hypothetical protein